MINMVIFIGAISVIIFALYFRDLKRNPLTTKKMIVIAMMSGLSFMLGLIQFVKYPQGGGITLFSMLPIMVLSLLYGRTAGVTGGLIWGLLSLLNGAYVIHPIQFFLDCLFGPMALGFTCIFGSDKKYKIILGSLFAVTLSVFSYFVSGVVFFAQFAPEGMNPYLYSFLYNFTSAGVEGILCTVLISIIPLKRFKKEVSIKDTAA
ncbi:energy-coupled thiamine transporter ThiT [Clostridium sp.]|uniref:energy-coupled thiamine transporter ThiT n=1 Tax=Clostridium sp. TaxID=1506 RepID=UPI0035223771